MNNILRWFYSSKIGGLYFEFLLWLDRKTSKPRYMTPGAIAQVVRESHKISEGIKQVKNKVNALTQTRTKDEYNKVLGELEDLMQLAEYDKNSDRAAFIALLKSMDNGKIVDVETNTEKAKMIERRINDHKELWAHKEKRDLIRKIRQAKSSGDINLVKKLGKEFEEKYGR